VLSQDENVAICFKDLDRSSERSPSSSLWIRFALTMSITWSILFRRKAVGSFA
jgi:hypothetical protein